METDVSRFILFSLSSTWKLRFRRFSSISLPFVVEPYLDGCPVKVVQFCKFFNNSVRWILAVFVQGFKGHFLQMRKFRPPICDWWSSSFPFSCKAGSSGSPDTRKNASNTDKRITNEKNWYKKARKVSFVRSIKDDE